MNNIPILENAELVLPNEINALNPAMEYVNGKNSLSARKFSGSISIGKLAPVVESCKITNANAMNRPMFPNDAKNKTIPVNTKLTKTAKPINPSGFSVFTFKTSRTTVERSNACTTASAPRFMNLAPNQENAETSSGFLKLMNIDMIKIPTNRASERT